MRFSGTKIISKMSKRLAAVIAYCSIVGWMVAFFFNQSESYRTAFVTYHLRQGFGLALVNIFFSSTLYCLVAIFPGMGFMLYLNAVFIFLWFIGMLNAYKIDMQPLPLIGEMFEESFLFIR